MRISGPRTAIIYVRIYEHMDDSSPPAGPSSRGAASSTTDSESRARPSSTIADKMFFPCIFMF